VGNEIAESPDILEKIFTSLKDIPVRMVSYGGSNHNISLLISTDNKQKALQLINAGVFGLE
jgi:aspartate kinase